MSKIKLTGDSSGYVEISAPSAAGNNTLELPASGSKIVVSDGSDNINVAGIVTASSLYTTSINDLNYPTAGPLSNRNLIINGDMRVAQRGITSTTTANTAEYNTVDRWYWNRDSIEELVGIMSQFSDGPSGYSKCWRFTTDNTAETGIESADRILFYQEVEAQNLQFLEYGQPTAKDVTCSFYVKSSEVGTYGFQIYQTDGNRIIGTTYTINAADTWEYKEITFPGDTGGTIDDDNGPGLRFQFTLVAGSNYTGTDNTSWGAYSNGKLCYGHIQNDVVTSVGNYWSVTGCQMEVGERATPFEHRSYGEELALCQRYYEIGESALYVFTTSGGQYSNYNAYKATKRAIPTVSATNTNAAGFPTTLAVQNNNVGGFAEYRIANATQLNGGFSSNWTSSAEL